MNKDIVQNRHGENLFVRIDKLPEGAKLVAEGSELVVAHSESGHNHILTVPKTAELKMFEFEGKTYLEVPLEAKLQHQKEYEKHPDQTMMAGTYLKLVDTEYDYFAKIMRKVID